MGSEIEPVPRVEPSEYIGDERQPFDRLDTETPEQYLWFSYYMSRGAARTYRETTEHFGLVRSDVQRIGTRNSWVERAKKYDVDRREKDLAELSAEVPVRSKDAQLLQKHFAALQAGMELLDPSKLTWRDVPSNIEAQVKYARLTAGISDAPKKVEITGAGGNPIELASAMSREDRIATLKMIEATLKSRAIDVEEDVYDAELVEDGDRTQGSED